MYAISGWCTSLERRFFPPAVKEFAMESGNRSRSTVALPLSSSAARLYAYLAERWPSRSVSLKVEADAASIPGDPAGNGNDLNLEWK
jgi:hypothetical protein